MTTRAVNLRHEDFDVYVGRKGHGYAGYYGNPFMRGGAARGVALGLFVPWFAKRVLEDTEFLVRVLELRGMRLGCFCKHNGGDSVTPLALPVLVFHDGSAYVDILVNRHVGLSGVHNPAAQDDIVLCVASGRINPVDGHGKAVSSATPIWKLHNKSGVEAFAFLPIQKVDEEVSVDVAWLAGSVASGACQLSHALLNRLAFLPSFHRPELVMAVSAVVARRSSRIDVELIDATLDAQSESARKQTELELIRFASDLCQLKPETIRYPLCPEVRIPLEEELGVRFGPYPSFGHTTPPWTILRHRQRRCHADVYVQFIENFPKDWADALIAEWRHDHPRPASWVSDLARKIPREGARS